MADSLLARVKQITGANDAELSEITGLSVHTVASYLSGRRREYLSAGQLSALRGFLASYQDLVNQAVTEFELFA